jgi:hypothetical protein
MIITRIFLAMKVAVSSRAEFFSVVSSLLLYWQVVVHRVGLE